MAIPYTQHDRRIAQSVIFKYRLAEGDPGGGEVLFQFPPKILSDNRKGTWNEQELRGVEPVSVFSTSGPREISLSWTYIVEDVFGRGGWDIEIIREQVNRLRGYFGNFKANNSSRDALIIDFKFSALTGDKPWSCRMKSIDVKHSENLIGDPDFCYPLRTDIVVDLRLWTKSKARSGDEGEGEAANGEVVDIGVGRRPTFEDYWF